MGGVGVSDNKSGSTQASGIGKEYRDEASRAGLDVLKDQAPLQIRRFEQLGAPKLNLNSMGLQSGTSNLFDTLINQAGQQNFTNASASSAQRGRISPQSLSQVLGDTARRTTAQLTPTFAPIAEANQTFNTLSPYNFLSDVFKKYTDLATLLGQFTQGGEGQQSSKGSSFGVNVLGFGGNSPGSTANSGG